MNRWLTKSYDPVRDKRLRIIITFTPEYFATDMTHPLLDCHRSGLKNLAIGPVTSQSILCLGIWYPLLFIITTRSIFGVCYDSESSIVVIFALSSNICYAQTDSRRSVGLRVEYDLDRAKKIFTSSVSFLLSKHKNGAHKYSRERATL
jgi:hypothetical protein